MNFFHIKSEHIFEISEPKKFYFEHGFIIDRATFNIEMC